jgi:hypothetical protein
MIAGRVGCFGKKSQKKNPKPRQAGNNFACHSEPMIVSKIFLWDDLKNMLPREIGAFYKV